MCLGSQADTQTGFLREFLGPVTFNIRQGESWDRRVEKAVDTMLLWLLGPQLVISSSLWAVGGRVHLQSLPSLDYPLSFPQQTPCYYPHQSLLCHLYKLSHPRGRASLRLQPAPCGGHRGRSEEPIALLSGAGRAWLGCPVLRCLDQSCWRPGAG